MKLIPILILFLILVLYKTYFNYENFSLKNNYIINDSDKNKKAALYNASKFTKLPNQLGNAIRFNGISTYMVIPDVNLVSYSLSLIFKQTAPSKNQILFSSPSAGFIAQIENKYLTFTMYSNEKSLKVAYKNEILPNEWIHLVLTYDGMTAKIYVNGNLVEGQVSNSNVCKTIIIGTDKSKRFFFNGFIGQIQILNRILGKGEVCSLHQMCKILTDEEIKTVEAKKRKKKCKFKPAGDTKELCQSICAKKKNCNPDVCQNLCNNCDDEKACSWLKKPEEDKSCKFIPYGPSKISCINTCNKEKNCDYLNCQKICMNCQDSDSCKWVLPPAPKQEEKEPIKPPPKYDPEGKPLEPVIYVKTYDGKVVITWKKPYNGDAPIEAYVCFLFKTFNTNEGIKISMVPFPKCEECTHVIDELDSNETYSVGIRAYNSLGLSRMSNIESFVPKYNFKSSKEIKAPIKLPEFSEYNFCSK